MSVKSILQSLGAPAEAVSWGAQYGDDFRLAWNECEHPELLLPMAAGMGVPNFDVVNAAIEVVKAHISVVPQSVFVDQGIRVIERFICEESADDEVVGVLRNMARMTGKTNNLAIKSAYGSVAHLGEASIFGENGRINGMMTRLSTAVMLSAQARSEVIAHGSSRAHKAMVIDSGLKGTASIARMYVPFESFIGGLMAAMNAEGCDEEMPYA